MNIPLEWKDDGFPDYNNFPLLFFLTCHPRNVNNLRLKCRIERQNCIVWKVYEQLYSHGNEYGEFIGLAVIPCTSNGLPRLPVCCGDQAAVGLFGSDEMLAIGVYDVNKAGKNEFFEEKYHVMRPCYMNYHYRDIEYCPTF